MRALLLLLIIAGLTVGPTAAQKKETKQPLAPVQAAGSTTSQAAAPTADSLHAAVYKLAQHYGDPLVAITAVYYQLAQAPSSLALKDSLAGLYFISRAYPQALQLAREVLAQTPTNLRMLGVTAVAEEGLGHTKQALQAYEALYAQTHSIYHQYQIAVLQYSLQRYGECLQSLKAVLANAEADKQKVVITLGQGKTQEVPLKAAAYNVQGVVQRDQKDYTLAQQSFEDALKTYPEFELAKNNLQDNKAALTGKK